MKDNASGEHARKNNTRYDEKITNGYAGVMVNAAAFHYIDLWVIRKIKLVCGFYNSVSKRV
jgi:hypothetical protein